MRRIRLLVALLLLPLAVACASKKKNFSEVEKRDYYSLNKHSAKYLGETFKQEPRLIKESFQRNWNMSENRRVNATVQKDSVKFAGSSLTALEWENTKRSWGVGLPRELRDKKDFWGSVRFGFLDSGE
ncbi:MAG: hypothetical protein ACYS0E_02635 [Planctomycetota bacterium]|jgi:hypothetical protein